MHTLEKVSYENWIYGNVAYKIPRQLNVRCIQKSPKTWMDLCTHPYIKNPNLYKDQESPGGKEEWHILCK